LVGPANSHVQNEQMLKVSLMTPSVIIQKELS